METFQSTDNNTQMNIGTQRIFWKGKTGWMIGACGRVKQDFQWAGGGLDIDIKHI